MTWKRGFLVGKVCLGKLRGVPLDWGGRSSNLTGQVWIIRHLRHPSPHCMSLQRRRQWSQHLAWQVVGWSPRVWQSTAKVRCQFFGGFIASPARTLCWTSCGGCLTCASCGTVAALLCRTAGRSRTRAALVCLGARSWWPRRALGCRACASRCGATELLETSFLRCLSCL